MQSLSGKKLPVGKRVGSGQLLKKTTKLGTAVTTTLCCLFRENEFSTQGAQRGPEFSSFNNSFEVFPSFTGDITTLK
jgi:hypothetical protein